MTLELTTGNEFKKLVFTSRDWWLSPVTLLLEGKNCGMAEGCYGLNQADGCISVAALRPPCQGKAHRGPAPMTRRLAQLNAATRVRVPGNTARPSSQYCNNVLKNVKIPQKIYKKRVR